MKVVGDEPHLIDVVDGECEQQPLSDRVVYGTWY